MKPLMFVLSEIKQEIYQYNIYNNVHNICKSVADGQTNIFI